MNGAVVCAPGSNADPDADEVTVDGQKLDLHPAKVYLALNKPTGYDCTLSDRHAERKVTDLLAGVGQRVYPVGRLDRDSAGLLLLTNDGEFAHRLMHPGHSVAKVYRLVVRGFLTQQAARRLARGVTLDDGVTRPAEIRILDRDTKSATTVVEATLREGRKRQLRRMFEVSGHPVLALTRTAIGTVQLAGLAPGTWRRLRPEEVASLAGHPKAASPVRPAKAPPVEHNQTRKPARPVSDSRLDAAEVAAAASELKKALGRGAPQGGMRKTKETNARRSAAKRGSV